MRRLYDALKSGCYLCRMRKILLMIISGVLCCMMPAKAQFNTVAAVTNRYKVETLQTGTDKTEPALKNAASEQDTQAGLLAPALPAYVDKKNWIDRYLSVCYPLQKIKVTSPYGYRKDPFTGKRKFHGGIDLYARGDKALAMMEGVVVMVGQDKTSGKYVTLRHGNYTVSYCHLSKILTAKGATVRPRDVVGITGSTGRSTGEHLHITCKLNGKSVNPTLLFDFIKATQQKCVSALAGL